MVGPLRVELKTAKEEPKRGGKDGARGGGRETRELESQLRAQSRAGALKYIPVSPPPPLPPWRVCARSRKIDLDSRSSYRLSFTDFASFFTFRRATVFLVESLEGSKNHGKIITFD